MYVSAAQLFSLIKHFIMLLIMLYLAVFSCIALFSWTVL